MTTQQEIFNTVYLGLMSQGFKQSIDEASGRCLYRGPKGLKCALGHLIPDARYSYAIEGSGARGLSEDFGLGDIIEKEHRDFYDSLQTIHDNCGDSIMQKHLLVFAERLELTVPQQS